MNTFIRKATIHDIDEIECLYDDLNDVKFVSIFKDFKSG